ncbi:uncharacterized protein LAESUDRAFT_757469 [Laetiporus sulphureus 93-53]|uniref:Uncharacterized protein n=1 Tax=Laetiporus sulphureus 93-53 TaxID=1314785 RepID=A0A165FCD7_9APHY|nr:uncharacterized protein LAESUDRAFT_757469 [Laetiporus sulphureus 93-53]KZT08756.1 hypothetical protein LAESUDRAFT_757469 [Laetiporus sulphureus 93-53]
MKRDAIVAGNMMNMNTISKEHSVRTLHAHGIAMGLGDGLMGNSEVGIDVSIKKRQFYKNGGVRPSAPTGSRLGRWRALAHKPPVRAARGCERGRRPKRLQQLLRRWAGHGAPLGHRIVKGLLAFTEKEKSGQIAIVVGATTQWTATSIKIAVDGLVKGKDETDEVLKPIVVNGDEGRIKDGDTLLCAERPAFPVAFPPQPMMNVLAEWLAK